MNGVKTLALNAHDGRKADRVAWATFNRDGLARYRLVARAATTKLPMERVSLEVEAVQPGPQGGDAQVGARVVEGTTAAVIVPVDPMGKHPHESDIHGLLRRCSVHNVPLVTNAATADCIITAESMKVSYEPVS